MIRTWAKKFTLITEAGWDEFADQGLGTPAKPFSFANFGELVGGCDWAVPIDYIDIAGNRFSDDEGEVTFYDAVASAPTTKVRGRGRLVFIEGRTGITVAFTWYLGDAAGTNYLVTEATFGATNPGDTRAFVAASGAEGAVNPVYTTKVYPEQGNCSTDGVTRSAGTDGEVWARLVTQQGRQRLPHGADV